MAKLCIFFVKVHWDKSDLGHNFIDIIEIIGRVLTGTALLLYFVVKIMEDDEYLLGHSNLASDWLVAQSSANQKLSWKFLFD